MVGYASAARALRIVAVLAGALWVIAAVTSAWTTFHLVSDSPQDQFGISVASGVGSGAPDVMVVLSSAAGPYGIALVAVVAFVAATYFEARARPEEWPFDDPEPDED